MTITDAHLRRAALAGLERLARALECLPERRRREAPTTWRARVEAAVRLELARQRLGVPSLEVQR